MENAERLSKDEETAVSKQLPAWAEARRFTEILRLVFKIPSEDIEELTALAMDQAPVPVKASLIPGVINRTDPSLFSVLGVFPSGEVRTIGQVLPGENGCALLAPFDYWSLIDPGADDKRMQSKHQLCGNLYICAVGTSQ